MRILLVAEEAAGMRLLAALAKTDHRIVGVMAAPERGGATEPSVWRLAQSMALPTWPAACVKQPDFAATLATENIDVLLNVHSLCVIREPILATARLGAFNLHPGPLPRYAGLNAPSWAIYNGEATHTVTVHEMAAGIDTGAIVYSESFPINDADTALTVSAKCVKLGIPLILRLLETLEADPAELPLISQDLSQRHYYGREVPADGRLDWARPAARIVDFVRACDYHPFASPWGHPIARLEGSDIGIVKAGRTGSAADAPPGTVTECGAQSMTIAAADESIGVRLVSVDGKVVPAPTVLKSGQRLCNG